jgi:hypothetical protein
MSKPRPATPPPRRRHNNCSSANRARRAIRARVGASRGAQPQRAQVVRRRVRPHAVGLRCADITLGSGADQQCALMEEGGDADDEAHGGIQKLLESDVILHVGPTALSPLFRVRRGEVLETAFNSLGTKQTSIISVQVRGAVAVEIRRGSPITSSMATTAGPSE